MMDVCFSGFIVGSEQVFGDMILYYLPAGNYMFKVNNRNTRTSGATCSKSTIKALERRQLTKEILEQGEKCSKVNNKYTRQTPMASF